MKGEWSGWLSNRTLPARTPPRPACCEKDKGLAVFLLPGLSGDFQEFAALLSQIEPPVQLVPIRYRHWSELRREPAELDRLVADCVRQIESDGPPGLILLVGYSFGGLMAWAVAEAMAASGYRIGLLALIDALACPKIEESGKSMIGRVGRVVRGVQRRETGQQVVRSVAGILFRSRARIRAGFMKLHRFGLLPRMFGRIDVNIQIRYHIILLKECMARMTLLAGRLDYPSVLFRRSDQPFGEDAEFGWARYLSNLRVVTLSGDHTSIMQGENVERIINQLLATISEAKGSVPSSTGQLYVNRT